jgi:hypothetical protein
VSVAIGAMNEETSELTLCHAGMTVAGRDMDAPAGGSLEYDGFSG